MGAADCLRLSATYRIALLSEQDCFLESAIVSGSIGSQRVMLTSTAPPGYDVLTGREILTKAL
jgi:hypothetical protein